MPNIIVLGCGRSGTSMLAGILSKSGHFMGDRLWPANISNPTGYFEDAEVNQINEDLLDKVVPPRWRGPLRRFTRHRPGNGQRWLAQVPVGRRIRSDPGLDRRIAAIVARRPFCLKDPRFSYTLPAWRDRLEEVRFIVVFRDPDTTANSILTECRTARYLHDLHMNRERAFRVWTLMYLHILEVHAHSGEWGWFHYDQLRTPQGLDRLEAFCGVAIDRSFPREELKRSRPSGEVPPDAARVYAELRERASHRDDERA